MTHRAAFCAVSIGVAGFFAMSAATVAAPKYPKDSYESWGAQPGKPPVPGFALQGYKPGLCWKVNHKDYQTGRYVPCSEWRKQGE